LRQNAINAIVTFIESGKLEEVDQDVGLNTSSVLLIVKEYTRGFKETNINIMKSILLLFVAVCQYHEAKEVVLDESIALQCVDASIQKISDRKLSDTSKAALTSLCVVSPPPSVILTCLISLKTIKSPIAHEEFLKWCQTFFNDFGGFSVISRIGELVPYFLEVRNTKFENYFHLRIFCRLKFIANDLGTRCKQFKSEERSQYTCGDFVHATRSIIEICVFINEYTV
jgi:hypothetical protein